MLRPVLRDELSQGDLIDNITVWDQDGAQVIPRRARIVVLSNDCEMDKPRAERSRYVLVVEMRSPADAGSANWGNVKAGKGWNTFYIPAGETVSEGYVDFGRIHRVERAPLRTVTRLASMSDEGREALVYALTSYLLHEDIAPPMSK
jgi:hypothetical protein